MSETILTQEAIDNGTAEDNGKEALYTKHPVLAAGAILVGAGLAYAAIKTIQSAADEVAREVHIETSITIDKSPEELFTFWRDFRNLPLFMKNVETVAVSGESLSHWVVKGIGGARFEWDAEVYNEIENQLIAWRSVENADVVNAGAVRFEPAPHGRGTYVRVTANYNPPAGKLGASVAELLGAEPAQLIKEDLRRLKQMLEAGEIARVDGQTSGRAREEREEQGQIKAAAIGRVEETEAAVARSSTA
jgi:uncharacterized membrane protein